MSRPKNHHQPRQNPSPSPRPALPAGVTPEVVAALAAMSRLGAAWQEYDDAVREAAAAVYDRAGTVGESADRARQVKAMLPRTPAEAIDAAGRNAVTFAALKAAAAPALLRGGAR